MVDDLLRYVANPLADCDRALAEDRVLAGGDREVRIEAVETVEKLSSDRQIAAADALGEAGVVDRPDAVETD